VSCRSCGSPKEAEFTAEVMIHFTGLYNLDKPGVWYFRGYWSAWIVALLDSPPR
jgi:hypothetical protein